MVRLASLTSTVLIASLAGACGDSGEPTPPADPVGAPAALRIVSGNEQRALAGQVLPAPVVVQVVDSSDRPVPDQPVAFAVETGGGTVSADTGYTNASGIVEQEWTLGPAPEVPQRLFVKVVHQGPLIFAWFTATATAAPTGLHFREVEAGGIHSCGLTPEGKLYCWGTRDDGVIHMAPTAVAGEISFASLAAGSTHTCALTPAGAAYCWGQNHRGQLGTGRSGGVAAIPKAVSGGLVFREIATGLDHTCALTPDGDAYCWGGNRFLPFGGQLGDGTTTDRLVPTRVLGGHTFRALALGGLFSCGLNAEGRAYCWGHRIGTRTGASDLTPMAVRGGLTFESISAGSSHVCGLVADGTAYCWGDNFSGQLGNGTLTEARTPVAVSGGLTFSALGVGDYHTCGITTSGALACWGWDDQFIDSREFNGGSSIHSTTPTLVPGALTLVQLSGGGSHGCGVTAEQIAYCWFDNGWGQLGSGDQTSSYQPVLVR
jgi:alpha-tubulin suppressor-like RCC1 family protein